MKTNNCTKNCEYWSGTDCKRPLTEGGCVNDPVELPLPEPMQFERTTED